MGKENADHLISVLQGDYEIDIDWEGTRYIGLTLDWDYSERKVHLSMPGYITKALTQFAHKTSTPPACGEDIWSHSTICESTRQQPNTTT